MDKGTIEESPPRMTSEISKVEEDTQIGVQAEIEEEELELPEQRSLAMGDQEDHEGIARRPNVWWGLR